VKLVSKNDGAPLLAVTRRLRHENGSKNSLCPTSLVVQAIAHAVHSSVQDKIVHVITFMAAKARK
jgi:hypothetical protein